MLWGGRRRYGLKKGCASCTVGFLSTKPKIACTHSLAVFFPFFGRRGMLCFFQSFQHLSCQYFRGQFMAIERVAPLANFPYLLWMIFCPQDLSRQVFRVVGREHEAGFTLVQKLKDG